MSIREKHFPSYIGKPLSNTSMYLTKKVENLIDNLYDVENCLVFCENTIIVPDDLEKKHSFVMSIIPQLDYINYVSELAKEIEDKNKDRKYTLTDEGYYIGENVTIGENAYIEPLCLIGHDVKIGRNAKILSNAKIKNCTLGDNVTINENCTLGTAPFTVSKDESGNNITIPSFGKIVIGDNVEIGALSSISVGTAGNTVINNYVKVDSHCYIAHDVELMDNVELSSGVTIGGFASLQINVFAGMNSTIRNRIVIGENSYIGMGSVVTKDVNPHTVVVGSPARKLRNSKK